MCIRRRNFWIYAMKKQSWWRNILLISKGHHRLDWKFFLTCREMLCTAPHTCDIASTRDSCLLSDIRGWQCPTLSAIKKWIKVWKIKVIGLGICIVGGKLPDSCKNSLIKVLGGGTDQETRVAVNVRDTSWRIQTLHVCTMPPEVRDHWLKQTLWRYALIKVTWFSP